MDREGGKGELESGIGKVDEKKKRVSEEPGIERVLEVFINRIRRENWCVGEGGREAREGKNERQILDSEEA